MSRSTRRKARVVSMAAGAVLLASCGGGDDDGAAGPPDSLVVWSYYTGTQVEALEEQDAIWEELHPDIPVEHVQIPVDQLPTRLMATATTQEGPDVIMDNVVVDFPTLVSGGVLADLSEYWEEYEDRELFPDSAVWAQDDKVYNVLSYTNLLGLYYNVDILDEYGIEPPETMADIEAAVEIIAEDGEYVPLAQAGAPTVGAAWMFMPPLLGEGVDYCNFEGDLVDQAFARMENWVADGVVPRETATWEQPDAWTQFASGKYAFSINGNWNIGDVEGLPFEVGTTRFPAGSEGSRVFPGGEGIGIGTFSDHPDLAWEYIETAWLSQEASLINFEWTGQIPTRGDLADHPKVTDNELVTPFVDAVAETGAWPLNEQTAAMQEAVGAAQSAVISGQKSGAEAATDVVAEVAEAREQGGGSC